MSADASVTVVVTRTVRVGKTDAYEAWLRDVGREASRFSGHRGLTVLRPEAGGREYTLIFRFDTVETLRAWESSDARATWVARADALCETSRRQEASGMEAWFASPAGSTTAPPPKWKMAVVGFLVAFPTIQILNGTLGAALSAWPALVRGALVGCAMIVFMTYVAMPAVTRWCSPWLYPRSPR